MKEYGLVDKFRDHTMVYVCFNCGEFIHFFLQPCIWCGYYPKTIDVVAKYDLLNSKTLPFKDLLPLARMVKRHEPLDNGFTEWHKTHHQRTEILKSNATYQAIMKDFGDQYVGHRINTMFPKCVNCKKVQHLAISTNGECFYCKNLSGMTKEQCWIISLREYLHFLSEYDVVVREDDAAAFEMTIGIAVRMLNDLVEGYIDLPDELYEQLRIALQHTKAIGIHKSGYSVRINKNRPLDVYTGNSKNLQHEQSILFLTTSLTFMLLVSPGETAQT